MVVNPFEKRATEHLRDDEAFLSVVSPEPLSTFFHEPAKNEQLFDRLVLIIGTPGSGKTTMTRLFQYSTIRSLLQNESLDAYRPLIASLTQCGAIRDGVPTIVGARIPLESEYRDLWDFPYPEELKLGLMNALIQARAVVSWVQNLRDSGVDLSDISVIPREGAGAATVAIGGTEGASVLEKASEIELAIYDISATLIPPKIEDIAAIATTPYRPFDAIDMFKVVSAGREVFLRPLVILDDAHSLHQDQFDQLRQWLMRRELKVARWVITRLDALTPHQVLLSPAISNDREITFIKMQSDSDRANDRLSFRKMARDMSSRYLRRMDTFNRRGLSELRSMLSTAPEPLPPGKLDRLRSHVDVVQRRTHVTDGRRAQLQAKVDAHSTTANSEELGLATLEILMERYLKRTSSQFAQLDLFADMEALGPDPNKPLTVDSGVVDGAAVHLLHEYERPYYFGIDALCDASSENAEQFLQLAGVLVSQLETKLIRRGSQISLTAREQNRLLRERATKMIQEWDFPHVRDVRALTEVIAAQCVKESLKPNAPLRGGANAFGVLQDEFEQIPSTHPRLAKVLQFAVAYNAVTLVQGHRTKRQTWCLIELGGAVLLKNGLTLNRGGFLERTVSDLSRPIEEHSRGK